MSDRARYGLLGILCTIGIVIWWHSLRATLALAFNNDAYSHIVIILPISCALLAFQQRRQSVPLSYGLLPGALLLAASVVLVTVARVLTVDDVRLAVAMLGFAIWLMGSFVSCFGLRMSRACVFPLLFLLWLVPMPASVLDYVVQFLQHYTASLARAMFVIFGVPVKLQGTALTIPGLTVEVARECSSIRSSLMLIVTSTGMAYIMLRSPWARALLICASLFLAVAKNALRVFTLAGLAAYVSPDVLNGPLHHQGGILFFGVALAIVAGMGWMLSRREPKPSPLVLESDGSRLSASALS